MPHPLASRWARLPLAAGAALLLTLAMAEAGMAATGDVTVQADGPNGTTKGFILGDPKNGVCHDTSQYQGYKDFKLVANHSDTPVTIYKGHNCTGTADTVPPNRSAHSIFLSFKVG